MTPAEVKKLKKGVDSIPAPDLKTIMSNEQADRVVVCILCRDEWFIYHKRLPKLEAALARARYVGGEVELDAQAALDRWIKAMNERTYFTSTVCPKHGG